jgi:7-cyano-7-deazaguanine synthase
MDKFRNTSKLENIVSLYPSGKIPLEVNLLIQEKALVVFSGGQDSTTCLGWALQEFEKVEAVTFNYNQRHSLEIQCAKDIATKLDVPHHILDLDLLNQLAPSALTRRDIDVKAGVDGALPSTFVEGRNHIFLSFAAIMAKQMGAKHIVTGVCQTDFSGYPDCRDVFIKSLNVTLNLAMDYEFVIHTPLMWLNKKETWALADNLGYFELVRNETLTCYQGIIGDGCGVCPSCQLRKNGLEAYLREREHPSELA